MVRKTKDKKCSLDKARQLKPGFRFDEKSQARCKKLYEGLFQNDFQYKIEQKYKEFEMLICNLISSETPVIWNRNSNYYTNNPDFSYNGINTFIKCLKRFGYVGITGFYHNVKDPSKGLITRAWSLSKLKNYFKNPSILSGIDLPLVELRDKNGQSIKYKANGTATKFKRHLRTINRVNNKAYVLFNKHRLNTKVRAIFTENFSYHGRLYTNGKNRFQRFSAKERELITIDEDPVVELDYSGLHPRILYTKEKIQFNEDPYSIIHPHRDARPFLKTMLLTMINCENFNKAQKTCNQWLNQEVVENKSGMSPIKKYQKGLMTEIGNKSFLETLEKTTKVKQLGIEKARPLMEKFLNIHKPIAKYLCCQNKTGMRLMNRDAKIALDVCSYFAKQGKAVLPIHDSFIVKKEYREELLETMQRIYKKHNNGFSCPIK